MIQYVYKMMLIFAFLSMLINSCGKPYVKLFDPATEKELITLHGAHITPGTIGKQGATMYIDYIVNKPLDNMTFGLYKMQFASGLHNFGWESQFDTLYQKGVLIVGKYFITNDWSNLKVTVHGYGRTGFGLTGYFTDKKGEEQRGLLSNYLEIPVEYE